MLLDPLLAYGLLVWRIMNRFQLQRATACTVLTLCLVPGSILAEDGRDCGHTARYCCTCERDTRGRIKRSTAARRLAADRRA